MKIGRWIIAARPKTLTAAIIPVLVGSALSFGQARFSLWISFLAALSAGAIQIGTNLFNDAIDFERGADTAERIGPTRITNAGVATASEVKRGALLCFAVALVTGAVLVGHGGWVILVIGLASLIFGYCYTGGPFPLAYNGLGELFALIFFGLVAVCGMEILHTGSFSLEGVVAGLQVGLLAAALIIINNARDIEQDRLARKMTLAARFGLSFSRWELILVTVIPYLLAFASWRSGHGAGMLLPVLAVPFSFGAARIIWREPPGPSHNSALGLAAAAHAVFGLGLSIGILLG